MINDLLSKLPSFKHDMIYDLIAYQDLKLCLDIGAAAGVMTKKIKEAGSEQTKVLAFEPFEGNYRFFLENTSHLNNVELIKKAVSDQSGSATFYVPSVVVGNERGWEKMVGYSSVGALLKGTGKSAKSNDLQNITVETVAICDLIDCHIDFIKIDVQGGEFEVLKGCEHLLSNHDIDVMYIEFSGNANILELLNFCGYSVFDTDYVLGFQGDANILQELGFYDCQSIGLSTGSKAYLAKLSLTDQNYCSFLKEFSKKYGFIQTDLICVSNSFLPQFIRNLNQHVSLNAPPSDRNATISHFTERSHSLHEPTISPSQPADAKQLAYAVQTVQNKAEEKHLALELIRRVTNYYRRWPMLLAIAAVFLNTMALLDSPFRVVLMAGGTTILLFLVGHAASKADYVLAELEDFKKHSSVELRDLRSITKKLKKQKV